VNRCDRSSGSSHSLARHALHGTRRAAITRRRSAGHAPWLRGQSRRPVRPAARDPAAVGPARSIRGRRPVFSSTRRDCAHSRRRRGLPGGGARTDVRKVTVDQIPHRPGPRGQDTRRIVDHGVESRGHQARPAGLRLAARIRTASPIVSALANQRSVQPEVPMEHASCTAAPGRRSLNLRLGDRSSSTFSRRSPSCLLLLLGRRGISSPGETNRDGKLALSPGEARLAPFLIRFAVLSIRSSLQQDPHHGKNERQQRQQQWPAEGKDTCGRRTDGQDLSRG
jgi:hypothetical protein